MLPLSSGTWAVSLSFCLPETASFHKTSKRSPAEVAAVSASSVNVSSHRPPCPLSDERLYNQKAFKTAQCPIGPLPPGPKRPCPTPTLRGTTRCKRCTPGAQWPQWLRHRSGHPPPAAAPARHRGEHFAPATRLAQTPSAPIYDDRKGFKLLETSSFTCFLPKIHHSKRLMPHKNEQKRAQTCEKVARRSASVSLSCLVTRLRGTGL